MSEFEDRQRQIGERKTARIYRSFVTNDFLLKGSDSPTLVQRMGVWIIGGFFVACGAGIAAEIWSDSRIASMVVLVASIALGFAHVRRGFRR